MIIESVHVGGTSLGRFERVKAVAEVRPHWIDGDTYYAPDEYHMHLLDSPYGGKAGIMLPSATPGMYAVYSVDDDMGTRDYVGTYASVLDAGKALLGPVRGGGYYRKGK